MLSFYRAMKKWDCLTISYEPMRRQTCCWWPYTLPVKSFGYFCLSKFPWSDQTLKKMHNLWKTYVYSLQLQTGLLSIHDFTWDKWSHHTLFLLADKSQWLKRTKNESTQEYTLIYIHKDGTFLLTLFKLRSEGPVTLHWGLTKRVFKESMQEKKDMRNEKEKQSMLCAWLALYKVHDILLFI